MLEWLAVSPSARRKGVGEALTGWGRDRADAMGVAVSLKPAGFSHAARPVHRGREESGQSTDHSLCSRAMSLECRCIFDAGTKRSRRLILGLMVTTKRTVVIDSGVVRYPI